MHKLRKEVRRHFNPAIVSGSGNVNKIALTNCKKKENYGNVSLKMYDPKLTELVFTRFYSENRTCV